MIDGAAKMDRIVFVYLWLTATDDGLPVYERQEDIKNGSK